MSKFKISNKEFEVLKRIKEVSILDNNAMINYLDNNTDNDPQAKPDSTPPDNTQKTPKH